MLFRFLITIASHRLRGGRVALPAPRHHRQRFIIPRPEWCCLINDVYGFIHLFLLSSPLSLCLSRGEGELGGGKSEASMVKIHHRENLDEAEGWKKGKFHNSIFSLFLVCRLFLWCWCFSWWGARERGAQERIEDAKALKINFAVCASRIYENIFRFPPIWSFCQPQCVSPPLHPLSLELRTRFY